jgi:hypothetical protein
LKQLISSKDKELLEIKAKEYDKVDVIKAQAESEGKIKFLNNENERLNSKV